MGVKALLSDGNEVELDPAYGATVGEVVESIAARNDDTLTGSAVPLHNELIKTADGSQVVYGDIAMFVDGALF